MVTELSGGAWHSRLTRVDENHGHDARATRGPYAPEAGRRRKIVTEWAGNV